MSEQLGTFSTISQELLLEPSNFLRAYEPMRTARECDDYEIELIRQGTARLQVGGRGAEISALASLFTRKGDTFHLHWRDRAMRLAVGIDLKSMVDCFFGLETENSTDRHLVNHDFDRDLSVYPIVTPVPSHCLPTCGVASTLTLVGGNHVSICSLGDGSTRQGEFLEAVTYSLENRQPILWLIIDNQYAISTPTKGRTALDLLIGSSCRTVQGQCIVDCLRAFNESLREIRETSTPRIIRLYVPRLGGHTSHDNETLYRSKDQIASSSLLDHGNRTLISEWSNDCNRRLGGYPTFG
jgi:2-oxoisovalerate dehydrogenase E1 component